MASTFWLVSICPFLHRAASAVSCEGSSLQYPDHGLRGCHSSHPPLYHASVERQDAPALGLDLRLAYPALQTIVPPEGSWYTPVHPVCGARERQDFVVTAEHIHGVSKIRLCTLFAPPFLFRIRIPSHRGLAASTPAGCPTLHSDERSKIQSRLFIHVTLPNDICHDPGPDDQTFTVVPQLLARSSSWPPYSRLA